ncbi:MAG: Flp family type IVb pilin [Bryobacteraceae bacterium]
MSKSFVKAFWQDEEGQDLVEYSLLLAFIALAAVGVLTTVKTSISTIWSSINSSLTAAAG